MKYQDTTITINREEEIKINDDLFATIGFSIDAEMTAEDGCLTSTKTSLWKQS
jgi:hypothetical protein